MKTLTPAEAAFLIRCDHEFITDPDFRHPPTAMDFDGILAALLLERGYLLVYAVNPFASLYKTSEIGKTALMCYNALLASQGQEEK